MKTDTAKFAALDCTDRAILVLANEMLALTEAAEQLRATMEVLCKHRGIPFPLPHEAPLAA